MGLFDALRGRRSDDASAVTAPSSLSAPELEGDRAGSAVDNIASTSAAASAAAAGIELPTGERLYNPYEGLAAAVDGRGMRGQYRLPAQVRNSFRRLLLRPDDDDDDGEVLYFALRTQPRIRSLCSCLLHSAEEIRALLRALDGQKRHRKRSKKRDASRNDLVVSKALTAAGR